MRTEELEMTKKRYMKKMRAGKLSGEELMLLLEINDQLAEETDRLAQETLAEAKEILKQAHVILTAGEAGTSKSEIMASDRMELVIADGSIMDAEMCQAMIEHIADGMKLEKAEYVGLELTVTLRNVEVDPTTHS
jgi:hypothetical protein